MACRWSAPSHYLNQCWNSVNWNLKNKLQWNFIRNSYIFIRENPFENVVWKKASILSRPQCVNIWNVNCAQATAFIFDSRTDVLVKVSMFLRQKISRPEVNSNPQPSDSCRMFWPFALSEEYKLIMSSQDFDAKSKHSQIAKFLGPTWGPHGSCRPQVGPILAPWILLSGLGWPPAKWYLFVMCGVVPTGMYNCQVSQTNTGVIGTSFIIHVTDWTGDYARVYTPDGITSTWWLLMSWR